MGDSWFEEQASTPSVEGFMNIVAQQLGVQSKAYGFGSAGFHDPGIDNRGNFESRFLVEDSKIAPDLVLLGGGIHDVMEPSRNVYYSFASLVDAVHTRFPAAQIALIGPAPATEEMFSSLLTLDYTLRSAAADSGVVYISPLTEGWIRVENLPDYVMSVEGLPSLNDKGKEYFARKLADALRHPSE
ncbi:SGNH/GDSL hydrolase family protein [Rhodococcus jostii]|nr:SGNH/GDSL hydrolase family protein [Rhodococcus jostii]